MYADEGKNWRNGRWRRLRCEAMAKDEEGGVSATGERVRRVDVASARRVG